MKKSIFFILIFIIVVLVLWGLATIYFPNTKYTQDIPSNVNHVTLSLNNSQISLDKPVLEVNIENSNNDDVTYGSKWTIERYVNQEWKKVFPINEENSTVQLYIVEPHSSRKETINLESYLEDELIAGEYRIVKEIEDGQSTHQLGITFEIK